MNLSGKVALVTGASRGIGRAIAIELAKRGANVVINYAGNEAAALETKAAVEALGQQAITVKADVSNPAEVETLLQNTLDHFEKIDILVNNAGITKDGLMMRMKLDDWDKVIDTNLKSVFLVSQKCMKPMIKQRHGRIINISSVVGSLGNAGQLNYVAAKSGVIGMTKTMALELSSRGITVNAVSPGFIETDMTDKLSDEVKGDLGKQIPLNRLGKPEDIAHAVAFLASEEAGYITGHTLYVNGGMHME